MYRHSASESLITNMKKLRNILTIGVMALTVLSSVGITSVHAAAPQAGDLIKMDGLSSVYYLGADGKRYVFPTSSVYFSWYNDFSGVITVSASELQSYPLGSNVTVRPGTKLVKITTDPSVYAVTPNGVLRKISSEADAIAIYGASWAKKVIDVPDAFFTNYTIGTALTTGEIPAGSLVKSASSASVYYYDGSNYRTIASEAAFNANKFSFANVLTVASTLTAGGTAISGSESTIVSPTGATTGVKPNTGSGVTVSLSAATPAAANVPNNGVRIPFTTVNFTASNDGAATVNSIIVKRTGLSNYNSFDKIWAEKDGVTVASKKTLNSSDEATLTFSPALTIAAGQTVSVDIIGSFVSAGGTGNAALAINSASAIDANGVTVSGSFPITGNLMSLTTYSVANLTITPGSSVVTPKVGDAAIELGSFDLDAPKDVTLKTITLKNNGSEDLAKATANLYLEVSGTKVSTNTYVNGRYVTFTVNNGAYALLKDDGTKTFKIKGDITAKENTGTLTFTLNKSTDLNAIETSTGFGTNVIISGGTSADGVLTSSSITITSGAINVSKKTTSPSDSTIVKGSTANVALIANIKADEAITADGLTVHYGSTYGGAAVTTDQFQNAKVYLNGSLVDSFDPTTSVSAKSITLDSSISLNSGDNELKVVVDSKSSATTGAIVFWVASDILTGENPEYVQSGNQIDVATQVGGSAQGAALTVGQASLSIANSDGYAAGKKIVKGSTDVSLGKFTIKAVNDAVTVTGAQLTATTTSGTVVPANDIYDIKFFVNGSQVGNTVDFGGSGANFSSLNFTVAKDTTKTIEVFGSFDSASVATNVFKAQLAVYAQDSKGKSVSDSIAATTNFAISGVGATSIAVSGNTPNAAIIAANGTEQEIGEYKITATDDSASLTEIHVYNFGAGSTVDTTADSRVSLLKLYDDQGNLLDSFTPVFGGGKFVISNDAFKVTANSSKTLVLKAVLNSISNDSGATNKSLAYGVTYLKSKSSNGTVSEYGNSADSAIYNSAVSNIFVVRKTVPTIAFLALPDATLNAGVKDIAKFSVTADAAGDVSLGRIALDVATTSGATLATSSLTNTIKVNGSTKNAYSVSIVNGQYIVVFATPEVISAGTTKTFEIQASTSVSGVNNSDSITAKISQDSLAAYSTTTLGGSTTPAGNFVWSDGADISNFTWANGSHVAGLDTNTWVLSK